jgi:glutamine phosphoribosylpyrophosphate amidotransferase
MVKENCGVVGIFSQSGTNVVPMAIDALRALQHRGQEAQHHRNLKKYLKNILHLQ